LAAELLTITTACRCTVYWVLGSYDHTGFISLQIRQLLPKV